MKFLVLWYKKYKIISLWKSSFPRDKVHFLRKLFPVIRKLLQINYTEWYNICMWLSTKWEVSRSFIIFWKSNSFNFAQINFHYLKCNYQANVQKYIWVLSLCSLNPFSFLNQKCNCIVGPLSERSKCLACNFTSISCSEIKGV